MFVNSVVLFGDLDDGYPFGTVPASKVSTDCHVGDDICAHGNLVSPHLSYCLDASKEASFAAARSGLALYKDVVCNGADGGVYRRIWHALEALLYLESFLWWLA